MYNNIIHACAIVLGILSYTCNVGILTSQFTPGPDLSKHNIAVRVLREKRRVSLNYLVISQKMKETRGRETNPGGVLLPSLFSEIIISKIRGCLSLL